MHYILKWSPLKNAELVSRLSPYTKDACDKKMQIDKD